MVVADLFKLHFCKFLSPSLQPWYYIVAEQQIKEFDV